MAINFRLSARSEAAIHHTTAHGTNAQNSGRGSMPRTIIASTYGEKDGFDGKKAADGSTFHKNALTAASRTLPFGTQVTLAHRGHKVKVRITDRGPYVHGRQMDVSHGAAVALGMVKQGVAPLQVLSVVFPAPRHGHRHTHTMGA